MAASLTARTGNRFLGPLVCALWAGFICYLSGQRGFFALDQSIVMNGAWRILSGQIPFRDFYLPYGPVSVWVQALAFQVGGLNYQTYVLTAVAMNIGGALLAYGTFRTWVPERRWPAWVAGLITGSWLYAPMGTAYVEQTGFFALWCAIFAVARGAQATGRGRWGWHPLAGMALAAAVLSKTNTGLLALPPLFAMAAVLRGRPAVEILRDWLGLALGLGMGFAAFYGWLVTASDPGGFVRCVLEIAGQEGRRRIFQNKELHLILGSLLTGKGNDLIRILNIAAYTLMALGWALAAGPWSKSESGRLWKLSSVGLLWTAYQQGFGLTSHNNGINEQPFIGLTFVCAVLGIFEILTLSDHEPQPGRLKEWRRLGTGALWSVASLFTVYLYVMRARGMGNFDFLLGVLLAWGIFLWILEPRKVRGTQARKVAWGAGVAGGIIFTIGAWGSYFRQAQDIFSFQTRYVPRDEIPFLRGLAWADGLKDMDRKIHPTWGEMVEICHTLRGAPGRFFLFGDYTMLYGATGKSPVGLLPWFHKGLTYPASYDPVLDLRLSAEVDQPDVTYFVTEDNTFMTSQLRDFPKLEQVLREKYRPEQKIGLFRLYRRIGSEGS